MHHHDGLVGKINPRIYAGDGLVIPLRNPAQEDSRQRIRGELHFSTHARNVVRRHHRSQHAGNIEDRGLPLGSSFLELAVRHRHIAGTKVYRAFRHLANAAAAANGLIVDLNARMQLLVFAEPLRINGIRERGARPV